MTKKWTSEFSCTFVPLPKEKEEAYWAAIRYFTEVMFADLIEDMPIQKTEVTETNDE